MKNLVKYVRNYCACLAIIALVAACTPAEQRYCEQHATPLDSLEYGKCTQYYFAQTALFNADRSVCEFEADKTYPSSLYDNGRTAYSHGGYYGGRYYGGESVFIEPDYAHNALVSNLRDQIIRPCMNAHGWVDPNGWEAGRFSPINRPNVKNYTPLPTANEPLPWLKSSR